MRSFFFDLAGFAGINFAFFAFSERSGMEGTNAVPQERPQRFSQTSKPPPEILIGAVEEILWYNKLK